MKHIRINPLISLGRIFLHKLIVAHLVRQFPEFYKTVNFQFRQISRQIPILSHLTVHAASLVLRFLLQCSSHSQAQIL